MAEIRGVPKGKTEVNTGLPPLLAALGIDSLFLKLKHMNEEKRQRIIKITKETRDVMGLAENLHSRVQDEQADNPAMLEKGRATLEIAIGWLDKAIGELEKCTDKE